MKHKQLYDLFGGIFLQSIQFSAPWRCHFNISYKWQCEKEEKCTLIWKTFRENNSAHCGKMKNCSHQNFFPSNQLFSDLFSKCVAFTKFLPKTHETNFRNFHTVQCGKTRTFLSLKNVFVKSTTYLVISLEKPLL